MHYVLLVPRIFPFCFRLFTFYKGLASLLVAKAKETNASANNYDDKRAVSSDRLRKRP